MKSLEITSRKIIKPETFICTVCFGKIITNDPDIMLKDHFKCWIKVI